MDDSLDARNDCDIPFFKLFKLERLEKWFRKRMNPFRNLAFNEKLPFLRKQQSKFFKN